MTLLALDQSSRVTGYAIFNDGQLIKYGLIKASSDDIGARLVKIRKEVKKLIEEFNVDEVIFEDIQLQEDASNNVNTFKVLAEVFGNLYELFTELKIPSRAVLASVWRSTLGIKGKKRAEKKLAAQACIKEKYNVDVSEDEADAICIGAHYLIKDNSSFDWS